jgi:small-conductance mechanosensitive channel
MTASPQRIAQLSRMEEARRQTQRQLDMIDRQIIRRMTALIPQLGRKRAAYRHGKPADPSAFLERYRSNLAAITVERQPEIDALSRKLARQDAAIEALRERCGAGPCGSRPAQPADAAAVEDGRRACRPGEQRGGLI